LLERQPMLLALRAWRCEGLISGFVQGADVDQQAHCACHQHIRQEVYDSLSPCRYQVWIVWAVLGRISSAVAHPFPRRATFLRMAEWQWRREKGGALSSAIKLSVQTPPGNLGSPDEDTGERGAKVRSRRRRGRCPTGGRWPRLSQSSSGKGIPNRARRSWASHLARGKWMTESGYRYLLRRGPPN